MSRAFTLIELLVTIAIMALLIGILLPALGAARKTARSAVCLASQRSIAIAMFAYTADHKEAVIPSFNMTDYLGATPIDGWAPILDRDAYIPAPEQSRASVFYCPETIDVEGMKDGQTGTDPNLPKGWMDWPSVRTGSKNFPVTIPAQGLHRVIRVSYWINADNPIGAQVNTITPDLHFTASVGYGPDKSGRYIRTTFASAFKRPSSLIATADGVYAGRHRDNKHRATNSRIGYRHPGSGGGAANVAFADGHASIVTARDFPRGLPPNPASPGSADALAAAKAENSFGKPTVYANPDKVFAPF